MGWGTDHRIRTTEKPSDKLASDIEHAELFGGTQPEIASGRTTSARHGNALHTAQYSPAQHCTQHSTGNTHCMLALQINVVGLAGYMYLTPWGKTRTECSMKGRTDE